MKKAFVTGASGFLGVNLVKALVKEDWKVTALVLPQDTVEYLKDVEVDYVIGDILDKTSLRNVMLEGDDVTVFHVAGMTSMWHKNDAVQYQVNVIGTMNVCEVALEKAVGKLVFTSSISAYGYHNKRISEETLSNALTCNMNYNKTKYLAESKVKSAVSKGLNAVIVNPCNIIGPYDLVGWSTLIISAYNGNVQGATDGIGTFAHVKDVVEGHIRAAEYGKVGENYLLGGVELSFNELISHVCSLIGKVAPKRSISPFTLKMVLLLQAFQSAFTKKAPLLTYPRYKRLIGNIICDDSKARYELGYKQTTINDMILDSYNWLEGEGKLCK